MAHATQTFGAMVRQQTRVRHRPDSTSRLHASWYWLRLLFVAGVSLYDIYLTYVFREVIVWTEKNPMGLWLIRLDPESLVYFTAAKTAGTLTVLAVLVIAAPSLSPTWHSQRRRIRYECSRGWDFVRALGPQLSQMMRRYREPIVSSVAIFQLWLLWYLTLS